MVERAEEMTSLPREDYDDGDTVRINIEKWLLILYALVLLFLYAWGMHGIMY